MIFYSNIISIKYFITILLIKMPIVTRTVIFYIDDDLVEVDIEVEEPIQGNVCRLCEKVELERENDIICPECWLSVGPADPSIEDDVSNENTDVPDITNDITNVITDFIEDDDMSYRSFKEMIKKRERTQSDESSEGGNS